MIEERKRMKIGGRRSSDRSRKLPEMFRKLPEF
jgi:hypothetical protein